MSPDVALVVLSVGAVALFLSLGVVRMFQTTGATQRLKTNLDHIERGEFDTVDTTLSRDRIDKPSGWFGYWRHKVALSGRPVSDPSGPGWVMAGIVLFTGAFGFLVFPGGPLGAVGAPLAVIVIVTMWLGQEAKKRTAVIEKQLPQLLSALRAQIAIGSTAREALVTVADDVPAPLGDELRSLKKDLNVAVPLDVALRQLSQRVPSREMQFLASSIEIAVNSGADLGPQLVTIESVVAQRTRLRQKLATAVASVRPTQIAAMVAVPLFFLNSLRSEENREFWLSLDGLPWLAVASFLTVFGVWGLRILVKRVENM